jgi:hypothetical protein
MASVPGNRRRLRRLALAALIIAVSVAFLVLLPRRYPGVFTRQTLLRGAVGFLVLLEIAYLLVVLAAGAGVAASGILLYWSRTGSARSLSRFRGLALSIGCLMAALLAEGIATGWHSWSQRMIPLTYGVASSSDSQVTEPAEREEVNVTVVGESSAVGVPFDTWLSVGKIVAWQLGEAVPGKRFRVDLIAKSGDTLAGQYQKLAAARRRPNLLIVYCGHNEFDSVVPWSHRAEHYLDDKLPLHLTAYKLAGGVSSVCALIRALADKCRVQVLPPGNAHPPLVDAPAYTPAEFAARLDEFRRRLEAIAVYGERLHAYTVLVIPPGNDGLDPNRSYLAPSTPRVERVEFERDFLDARRLEETDEARAIVAYRALLAQQPTFAETHHRLGVLLSQSGAWEEAYRHFVLARNLDGFPLRCVTSFQDVYRELAARHQCIVIDGQSLFHAIGRHGLLDDYLFQDAMHPSLHGYVALAQHIVDSLHGKEAFGWSKDRPAPEIDLAKCAAHFGLDASGWKTLCERGAMFYYATIPMRYDRTLRLTKFKAFEKAVGRVASGEPPEAVGLPNIGIPANARLR